jgi:hypothetical protein
VVGGMKNKANNTAIAVGGYYNEAVANAVSAVR